MGSYVVGFEEIDRSQIALVGGKGANLGELSRIEGIRVPGGFCVTTDAFRRIMAEAPSIDEQLDHLSSLSADDREAIRTRSADLRRTVEEIAIPDDLAAPINAALAGLGDRDAYAVRSSATAEDLPTASFAGQHDSFLNVVGPTAILGHISRCWASLYSERAVAYRLRDAFDHRTVSMAVVVQRMVVPDSSGVLFTADPVTGDRKVTSVEATFGLGDALVSGLVNPDVYKVRGAEVVDKVFPATRRAVLTDAQLLRLAQLGRQIESHFGCPQDIEWCLGDDEFQIVQARPITTLYPIPPVDDGAKHVYISVGHQQMMTDPMKPLGLSFWLMTTPAPMTVAGGRLFVDVTQRLASAAGRAWLIEGFGRSEPLVGDALRTIIDRGDFASPPTDEPATSPPPAVEEPAPIETDPAIVTELIARNQASVATLKREIRTHSGSALFDFIVEDMKELKRLLFDPQSRQVYMSAMEATWWLNEHLQEWLGETNAADTLTQSVPNNVTSEMGLALLDVADVIRPHDDVVAFLQEMADDDFLDELTEFEGGREARDAIRDYLDRYGMRCVGEIDITRPRWSERPAALLPVLLGNIKNFQPGAGEQRFEEGRQEAWEKEQDLLRRLRRLPDGEPKAEETKRKIDCVRTFMGYREYPKFGMVSRYFLYKRALLEEAGRLVEAHVIDEAHDIYFLSFEELREVVRTQHADRELIGQRKEAFASYGALTPPRVLTSDGEMLHGAYRREDLPPGALIGLPVSAGTVEGRARVILDIAEADLEPGDILITSYTDPSWSPLFVAISGLATEVGGQMTHGAVVAREYGLPAVVGVEHATTLIRDGQRIRLNGTDGYIEILSP